jgi:hypothetical protein
MGRSAVALTGYGGIAFASRRLNDEFPSPYLWRDEGEGEGRGSGLFVGNFVDPEHVQCSTSNPERGKAMSVRGL